MVRWLVLALALLVLHVTLSVRAGATNAIWPLLAAMALQTVAVAAVLVRWRRSPGEARQLWLLLAMAIGMQWLCSAANVLSIVSTGDPADWMSILAAVFSGLYMVPVMFMTARSFSRDMPRMVSLMDILISVCVTVMLFALIVMVMALPPSQMREHVRELAYLGDAVNYSLALLASIRVIGGATRKRRHAYFAASTFLWINAVAISAYNRMEQSGLPWWGGVLLDVAFVAVIVVAARVAPAWLRRMRPSRQTTTIIDGFAPIVLSINVLTLGIGVSRLNFGVGMLISVLSVVFYGLRMAYIQSRDQNRERLATMSNQRLQRQLGMDPMTGIANRGTLDAHLREILTDRRRTTETCSVLMIDVDLFKQYNDTLGHIAGDHCLVRVVGALRSGLLRPGDLIARYGGEEFAVVMPDTGVKAAAMVGQRLVDAVAELGLTHPTSPYGRVTVSVGAATCPVSGNDVSVALLDAADQALYQAKHDGRNRCVAEAPLQDLPADVLSS